MPNNKTYWRQVRKMTFATKARIQATLTTLSADKGLPHLLLSRTNRGYVARQYSEMGVEHPLVEIVIRGRTSPATVMFDGEVYE